MKIIFKIIIVFLLVLFSHCKTGSMRIINKGELMEMNTTEYLVGNNVWQLVSNEYFKFYFDKNISEKTKNEVIKTQTKNIKKLFNLLEIKHNTNGKINYWLFKSKNQKIKLTKVSSDAHSISSLNSIYHLPKNAFGSQELGHIIVYNYLGFIEKENNYSLVLDEGFNYFIGNKSFYQDRLTDLANKAISNNSSITPYNLITRNGSVNRIGINSGTHKLNESYVAGAFVKYLIDNYGIIKFKGLWKRAIRSGKKSNPEIFNSVYGISLNLINEKFIADISNK